MKRLNTPVSIMLILLVVVLLNAIWHHKNIRLFPEVCCSCICGDAFGTTCGRASMEGFKFEGCEKTCRTYCARREGCSWLKSHSFINDGKCPGGLFPWL
ncbi:MAG: hypothetical protein KAR05_04430 [Candidatus Omnitrophica bacterium]|nr:hypothetical protein [Candidatus Omnitrophota bacterium]